MSKEVNAIAAAPGIAQAPLYHLRSFGDFVPTREIRESRLDDECERFRLAIEKAVKELDNVTTKLTVKLKDGHSGLWGAQRALLLDPAFSQGVEELIREKHINAEVAVQRVVAKFQDVFESMDDIGMRQRGSDVRDVGRQVMRALLQRDQETLNQEDADVILAVDEFMPSDIARVDTQHLQGILMAEGGKYSHGAILARSLGIPCLVGLQRELVKIRTGELVIVDGDGGKLIVDPEEKEIELYRERMQERDEAERRVFEVRLSPSVTRDGTAIHLYANIESPRELEAVEEDVFEGIGLFRTEFAFMERLQFPSEEEQFTLYKEVLEHTGRRVTFRVLDVGGDKPLPYLGTPIEHNPVLGWRGIRLTLTLRDLFYTQLRALVRASAYGQVSILLPMVTTIQEVKTARGILDEIVTDLKEQGEPVGDGLWLGVMLEVPALGQILDLVFPEIDFISVGSNDLTQYLLAVDRDNPRVSPMYDPCHPGVLRILSDVISRANEAGIPCSLCGEIAGESQFVPLLLGMGFRSLSMSPVFMPRVKLSIRSVEIEQCEQLWQRVKTLGTAEEIRDALRVANKNGK